MMVATRAYYFTWNELCHYFPEKRIAELRFTILNLHRSGWTRRALMDEFKMSENTLVATLKRYKNAKCAEDCMDKTRAPKNPGRKFSSQTKQKVKEMRKNDEAKAEEDCAKWIEDMKASGAKLSNAKIEKQKERINKSVPGIRKITAKYNFEAEREGRPKNSKSWVAKLLESRQVENKQQNVSRKHHRRSFPGVEFQADTAALYIHKGKQVAFLDIVDISNSSIAVTCASSSKDHNLVLKGFKGLREKYPDGKIILRSDNGGEFIDARVALFCKDNNIDWIPNNEGQPWEGCYVERSIGTLKNEYICRVYILDDRHLEVVLEQSAYDYNTHRPHMSFGGRPPYETTLFTFYSEASSPKTLETCRRTPTC